jgi:cytochrome c
MSDNFNTMAGWALAAGICALGFTIVSGEMFAQHPVEHGGYPVEGEATTDDPAVAELPIATLLATADPAKGSEIFKKCSACHTVNAGGANGTGPNLHAIVGKPIGKAAGFAYSSGVAGKGGNWDFEAMNSWLKSPKKFIEGTKMSFAGLSNGADRANVIAYLNGEGSNLPYPKPEAAPAAPAAAAPAK